MRNLGLALDNLETLTEYTHHGRRAQVVAALGTLPVSGVLLGETVKNTNPRGLSVYLGFT